MIDWLRNIFRKEEKKPEVKPEEEPQAWPANNINLILDTHSQSWLFIKQWTENRINELRIKNDNVNSDIIQTMLIRGKIKAFKEVLALQKGKTVKNDDEP